MLVTKKIFDSRNAAKSQIFMNEIVEYLNESCFFLMENIFETWRLIQSFYFILAQMIKNILNILVSDVDVERLFFLIRDVIDYRRNRLQRKIIENIMIFKKTFQIVKNFSNINSSNDSSKILSDDEEISKNLMIFTTKWFDENDDDMIERFEDEKNVEMSVDNASSIDVVVSFFFASILSSVFVNITSFFTSIVPSIEISTHNNHDVDLSKYFEHLRRFFAIESSNESSKKKRTSMIYAKKFKRNKND